jgi:hypothetical protein
MEIARRTASVAVPDASASSRRAAAVSLLRFTDSRTYSLIPRPRQDGTVGGRSLRTMSRNRIRAGLHGFLVSCTRRFRRPASRQAQPTIRTRSLAITRLSQPALSANLDGPIAGAGLLAAIVNDFVILAVPDMLAGDDPFLTCGTSARVPRLKAHASTPLR